MIKQQEYDDMMPSFRKEELAPHIDFDKVFKLFTGKHTSTMYDRQAAAVSKICLILESGITESVIPHLAQLLVLIKDKIEKGGLALLHPVGSLLSLCGLPIIMTKRDKRAAPGDNFIHFVQNISEFVRLPHYALVEQAAEALYSLSEAVDSDRSKVAGKRLNLSPIVDQSHSIAELEKQQSSSSEMLHLIEQSNIIPTLVRTLEANDHPKCRSSILRTLRRLSISPNCCSTMISAGSLTILIQILSTTTEEITIYVLIELVWNLLSCPDRGLAAEELGINEISNIQDVFARFLSKSHHLRDMQLRNEITIIALTIAETSKKCRSMFLQTGFTDVVSLFLMCNEMGVTSPLTATFSLTQNTDDYELKKLLLRLAQVLCSDIDNLERLLQNGLLDFLLMYLDVANPNTIIKNWSLRQLTGIQLQTIGILIYLIPRIPHFWSESPGNNIILRFLGYAIKTDALPENGHIVSSGRIGLVGETLRLILSASELGPSQKRQLGAQGVFPELLGLLEDKKKDTGICKTVFLICSSLCQGCKANKVLFGDARGVASLIPFLAFRSPDPNETESMLLCVIEAIWGAICGYQACESSFFQAHGIFMMLNLLESATPALQKHILGCIMDLMENPKARSHLLEWRTVQDEKKGIAFMLIQLWVREELRLSVPQGANGTLVNVTRPLIGIEKDGLNRNCSSDGYAIEEIAENLRAKIYSLFCKLGFDHFHEIITAEERIKLTLISKYLDFKIGEVWDEIADELYLEGIRPVTPDHECIRVAKEVIVDKARVLQQKQEGIMRQKSQHQYEDELQFYETFAKRG